MAHLRFGGQVSFYQSQIHEKIPFWHFHKQLSWFFSRALQGATLHMSLCDVSGCLSVCPFQETPPPPPTKCDFWAAQAILSNFHFQKKKKKKIQIFFSPPKKFPTFTFLCISGCFMPSWVLKRKFHPKCFWVKQGVTQCHQEFLVWKSFGWTPDQSSSCRPLWFIGPVRFGHRPFQTDYVCASSSGTIHIHCQTQDSLSTKRKLQRKLKPNVT